MLGATIATMAGMVLLGIGRPRPPKWEPAPGMTKALFWTGAMIIAGVLGFGIWELVA